MIILLVSQVITYSYERIVEVEPDVVSMEVMVSKAGFSTEEEALDFLKWLNGILERNTLSFEQKELRVQPIYINDEKLGMRRKVGYLVSLNADLSFKSQDELNEFKRKIEKLSKERKFDANFSQAKQSISYKAKLETKLKLMDSMLEEILSQKEHFGSCNLVKVDFDDIVLPPDEEDKLGLKAYITLECKHEAKEEKEE